MSAHLYPRILATSALARGTLLGKGCAFSEGGLILRALAGLACRLTPCPAWLTRTLLGPNHSWPSASAREQRVGRCLEARES